MIPAPYIALAVVAMCAGAYGLGRVHGGSAVRDEVQAQQLKAEAAVATDQAKQATQTVKVVTEYVDRVQVVEKHVPVVRDRLVRVCDQASANRVVPGGAGDPHARAASDTDDRHVDDLAVDLIACRENSEQLRALIEWKRRHGG